MVLVFAYQKKESYDTSCGFEMTLDVAVEDQVTGPRPTTVGGSMTVAAAVVAAVVGVRVP